MDHEQDPLLAAQQTGGAVQLNLEEFKLLTEKLWAKKQEHTNLKKKMELELSHLWGEYLELEREVMRIMEASKTDKFIADSCTVSRSAKSQVKIEDKNLLLNHLQETGELLNVLRLNVTDVTKFYQEKQALAEEHGDFDFKIPGVSRPNEYYSLSLRKR